MKNPLFKGVDTKVARSSDGAQQLRQTSMFCAYHLLTSRPLTAMRIQLERWIAEWTPQLGPHTSILLTAQHDLGPRTGHLQGPWVWQTLPRWFALIGAYGEGQNLILQITPWLLPTPRPLPAAAGGAELIRQNTD